MNLTLTCESWLSTNFVDNRTFNDRFSLRNSASLRFAFL